MCLSAERHPASTAAEELAEELRLFRKEHK